MTYESMKNFLYRNFAMNSQLKHETKLSDRDTKEELSNKSELFFIGGVYYSYP